MNRRGSSKLLTFILCTSSSGINCKTPFSAPYLLFHIVKWCRFLLKKKWLVSFLKIPLEICNLSLWWLSKLRLLKISFMPEIWYAGIAFHLSLKKRKKNMTSRSCRKMFYNLQALNFCWSCHSFFFWLSGRCLIFGLGYLK